VSVLEIPPETLRRATKEWRQVYNNFLNDAVKNDSANLELHELFILWVLSVCERSLKEGDPFPTKTQLVAAIFELAIEIPKAPMFFNSGQDIVASLEDVIFREFNYRI
jgi:hypothetical protein